LPNAAFRDLYEGSPLSLLEWREAVASCALALTLANVSRAEAAVVARDTADVRVCAGGDVTLGTNLDTSWVRLARKWRRRPVPALPKPDALLAPLTPLVADGDVVLVNVEGAIGDGPATRKCTLGSRGCFALRQPASTAAALRHLSQGAVVGNVANNHVRDAGVEGFHITLRHLNEAGVLVTGADTLPTLAVTARGDTVAFLGFSASSGPDPRDLSAVRRHVSRAAAQYPRLVVTMHVGAEGAAAQRTRDTIETYLDERRGNPVAFARAAVESGAKMVIGHGPHVVRAVEWQGGALIAYSLGNLVTYGPFSLRAPLDRGAILCAVLAADGSVRSATLRPTRQRPPGLVAADRSGRALLLADSLGRLDFPRTRARFLIEAMVLRRAKH
jgi:hypothetical protein